MFKERRERIRSAWDPCSANRDPLLQRGRKQLIVRWIGARKHKLTRLSKSAIAKLPITNIAYLSFADTFDRRKDVQPGWLARPSAEIVHFLPAQGRRAGVS
ncbi:hypothetical protein QO016_002976 [Methylobacterium persicinum]|uniref:Uncharacterized protein n=1 Tax=Methylobacterium persicinum TaxID=374426 RepID=A0ABU0HNR5_9HYPH|nr:hypothetical protein [Methylobacterium persicinum]GJE38510.1 hypothetical protein KHHGKMAE_2583 [Methylobacterium persicinum]